MKKAELAASVTVPSLFLAQASLSLSMMQTGGSVLDFLRPVMPFFSQLLGFFGNLLIPLGQFFGELLQGPLTALSQAIPARTMTGYALYFVMFAGIFILALMLNVVWRPLGYATTESRAKREEKEIKEAEREEQKEAAKAEAKANRKRGKAKPLKEDKDLQPDKVVSGEPKVETKVAAENHAPDANPPPAVIEEKENEDEEPAEGDADDGAAEGKAGNEKNEKNISK